VLLAALLVAVAFPGAAARAQATDTPPAAPAFYTGAISRVSAVEGDTFLFRRDDGKTVRVRLAEADCKAAGEIAVAAAKVLSEKLLQDPFWVFPTGQVKTGETEEIYADVWTPKGPLSYVLIRAGYAKPRTDPPAGLAATDPAGTSNKGPDPAPPAFLATSCKPVAGDTYEVEQADKKLTVRLLDCAAEGASPAEGQAAATRALGTGPVWVFPCGPAPSDSRTGQPVRIWTAQGWLADALVKGGFARRIDPFEKPAATPTQTAAKGETPPKSVAKREPPAKPEQPQVEWRPIAITLAKPDRSGEGVGKAAARTLSMGIVGDTTPGFLESQIFKISSGVWKVTWEPASNAAKTGRVMIQVYRCAGNTADTAAKFPASQAATFSGPAGNQVLRTMVGSFWLRVTSGGGTTVKVEEAYPVANPGG
jgi:endonuclease YncB( thermonuclease family)